METKRTQYVCIRCKRVVRLDASYFNENIAHPATDAPVSMGGSHDFCDGCLDVIEIATAVAEARIARKHGGLLLSTDALMRIVGNI